MKIIQETYEEVLEGVFMKTSHIDSEEEGSDTRFMIKTEEIDEKEYTKNINKIKKKKS